MPLGAMSALGGAGPVGGGGYTGGAGGSAESTAASTTTFRDVKSGDLASSTGAGQRAQNISIAFPGANIDQPGMVNNPTSSPLNVALAVGGIVLAMGTILILSKR